MPYTEVICGIYAIINRGSRKAYIGQSRNIRKRLADHQNLLKRGIHPNPHLQNAWNKHGEYAFEFEIIATCDDPDDLNSAEAPFLDERATYDGCSIYNIAKKPQAAMAGRKHSAETRALMSRNRTGKVGHVTEAYRRKLSEAQIARHQTPERIALIKSIIELVNSGVSYKKTGLVVGKDTSSTRRLYLTYKDRLIQ